MSTPIRPPAERGIQRLLSLREILNGTALLHWSES
jgi:hypothetical protein